jgi:hypothetical protein
MRPRFGGSAPKAEKLKFRHNRTQSPVRVGGLRHRVCKKARSNGSYLLSKCTEPSEMEVCQSLKGMMLFEGTSCLVR